MDYTTLGQTGIRVSVAGLGCGGPSRLGQKTGRSETESIAVVRTALDLGINLIDTAEAYGTEEIVGKAVRHVDRDSVVISTKKGVRDGDRLLDANEYVAGVERCLQRLDVDHVDIMHMHGLRITDYEHARREIVPALVHLRQEGKIRFLGVTESFGSDTTHKTLERAVADDCFDVVMVGFNMLNHSARRTILPAAQRQGIGVLDMFAVRRAFSDPQRLQEILAELDAGGQIELARFDSDEPLGFLMRRVSEEGATSAMDAAYRYCRHEAGVDVVLTGTGNVEHLRANVESILQPPLPADMVTQINDLFGNVDTVSGS